MSKVEMNHGPFLYGSRETSVSVKKQKAEVIIERSIFQHCCFSALSTSSCGAWGDFR